MQDLFIINVTQIAASGGVEGLISTGEKFLKILQSFGLISTAIGFSIGAMYLIWGGDAGRPKARSWFIGGAVGLIVLSSAYGFAQMINSNISF